MIISSSRIYGILIKSAGHRSAEAEIVSWPFQNTSFRHVNFWPSLARLKGAPVGGVVWLPVVHELLARTVNAIILAINQRLGPRI